MAWHAGFAHNRGDFYATLPGAYAETLNPDLWNSTDLRSADGYHRQEYLYGPTQYLTILPLIFLDSYAAVARVLLFVYLPLIGLAIWFMWRAFRPPSAPAFETAAAVAASTTLFLPILQAYGQREFEIVILAASCAAVYALVTSRQAIGGLLIAYATWFKFFPLAFLAYFVIRGWRRAALAFVVASLLLLGVTQLVLGLPRFGAFVELARVTATASLAPGAFCESWADPDTRHNAVATATRAGIKWAACSFADRWAWVDAQLLHVGVLAIALLAFASGHRRLSQSTLDTGQEQWRRSLEAGLVLTLPWLFSHAHYYYLAFAIVPLNALLVRHVADLHAGRFRPAFGLWLGAYALLGALVIPPSVLSAVAGFDFWAWYMRYNISFFGELLLIGLVLWEYVTIPIARAEAPARYPLAGRLIEAP